MGTIGPKREQRLSREEAATDGYSSRVLPGLLLTAVGLGLAFPTAFVAVTAGVRADQQGLAGGLFITAQQVGAAVGLAGLATIAAARTRSSGGALVEGYRLSFVIASILVAIAVVVVLVELRHETPRESNR